MATPMLDIKARQAVPGARRPRAAALDHPGHDLLGGAGEFLTMVGPSGAGKSTLLNMIAQIEAASAGEIVFDGERIAGTDEKALHPGLNRRIGYVTQDDNLLPWRTTLDNVLFPLEVQGALDEAARARAQELIARSGPHRLREDIIRTNCPAACASARR